MCKWAYCCLNNLEGQKWIYSVEKNPQILIIKINLININCIAKIVQLFILKRAGHSSCEAVRAHALSFGG